MSYLALYRKYRPQTFEDVIGQDSIIKTLKNQITAERISHAYLFCGTRGTGKTSSAKIFASAINCLTPHNGEPCGKCAMCTAMHEGRSVNVIEMDAASNNGVDNIREIREEVKYPPAEGNYKVYIIDEVHMLSAGAFNALLKTLEEPPPHVVFILATTDPQKIPVTILSRCQRFDFRRIAIADLLKTLQSYAQLEHVAIEEQALWQIARLGDGSMRDCLSLLDRCLSFYTNETITEARVLELTGAVDNTVFLDTTDALSKQNIATLLDTVEEVVAQGRDMRQFVQDFTQHLRNLLLVKTVQNPSRILDLSAQNIARLGENAALLAKEELIYYIRIFSDLLSDMRYAQNPRLILEITLIKLTAVPQEQNLDSVFTRLSALERQIKEGALCAPAKQSQKKLPAAPAPSAQEKPKPPAVGKDFEKAIALWPSITEDFEASVKAMLLKTTPVVMEEGVLSLICPSAIVCQMLDSHKDDLQQALADKLQKKLTLKTVPQKEYDIWYEKLHPTKESAFDPNFESLIGSYIPDAEFDP